MDKPWDDRSDLEVRHEELQLKYNRLVAAVNEIKSYEVEDWICDIINDALYDNSIN
jgi:hypothetical protein